MRNSFPFILLCNVVFNNEIDSWASLSIDKKAIGGYRLLFVITWPFTTNEQNGVRVSTHDYLDLFQKYDQNIRELILRNLVSR